MINTHYSEMLKKELLKRCSKNKSYSLRAYARDLAMTPSQVSSVLNRRKNISVTKAFQISDQLFENKHDQEYFIALVQYATAKTDLVKHKAYQKLLKLAEKQAKPLSVIDLDRFHYISNWYYTAVLDLTSLDQFKPEPKWISSYLGISEFQAKEALERLQRMELLVKENGTLKKFQKSVMTTNDVPSPILREFHRQMMTKAIASLETQSVDERYTIGQTMAIRKKDIPKFKKIIDEALDELSDLARSAKVADGLYQVNIQFFDLKDSKRK